MDAILQISTKKEPLLLGIAQPHPTEMGADDLPYRPRAATKQPIQKLSLQFQSKKESELMDPDNLTQLVWSQFSSMTDSQRNSLLKGLLARSGSKQVEAVCTSLNLKVSDSVGLGPTV